MQDFTAGFQWFKKKRHQKLKLHLRHIHTTHQIIKGALSPIPLVSNFLLSLIEVRQPPVEPLALLCRISVYSWCRQWLQAGLWITPHGDPCPPTAMTRSLQITWKNSSQLTKRITSNKMFLCRSVKQRANAQGTGIVLPNWTDIFQKSFFLPPLGVTPTQPYTNRCYRYLVTAVEATCLHPRTLVLRITSVLSNSFKSSTFSTHFYNQCREQVLHLAPLGTSKQVLIFSSNPLHPSNIYYIPSLHSVLQALHSGFASFDTKEWLMSFSRGISNSERPSG